MRRMVPSCLMLACLLAPVSCSSSTSSGASNYSVAYALAADPGGTFDSVKYDNGHGTLIKVDAPANGWLVSLSVASGGSLEAGAWGYATAGGQHLKLTATWTLNGVSTSSDSSTATSSAPGAFAFGISNRTI